VIGDIGSNTPASSWRFCTRNALSRRVDPATAGTIKIN
jgi:hypothetical protein